MHVPEGWRKVSLSNVAEIRTGVAKGKQNIKDPIELPYLRVANVQDGYIDLSDVKNIQIERNQIERFSLKIGDVLMTEGGDFDKLGRGDVWNGHINPCLHQNHVFAVRPNQLKLDSYFLAALSASHYGKTYFLSCSKQSTNLASINSTQLKDFPVLLPPFPEQQKLAQILSTWDKAIEKLEALIAAKQKRKKALMQELLTGKKRFAGFEGEWKKVSLKHVLRVRKELSLPTEANPLYSLTIESGVTEKTDRYNREFLVKDSDNKKYKIVYPNDIVYNPANLRWGAINISRINHKVVVSPIYEVLYIKNINEYCHSYVSHLLMSPRQIAIFACMAEGTLVERMAVKIETFLAATVLMPSSIEEQQNIASVLTAADTEIATHQQQLAALKQQKKGLMQQLLTGKKRVKVDGHV
jgi:type I restriction enzyme S subunit